MAPALSESLSNFTIRRMPRTLTLRTYATTHPKSAMISIASRRGTKCSKFLARSCIAWSSSPIILSHIFTSLSCVP